MENLGTAADITGGSVEIVDPTNLKHTVGNLLASKTFATNLVCTVLTNGDAASFVPADSSDPTGVIGPGGPLAAPSTLTRQLASVTDDSDLTFAYTVRSDNDWVTVGAEEKESKEDEAKKRAAGARTVPFQVQLRYTLPSGEEHLQTISRRLTVSDDRCATEADGFSGAVVSLEAVHRAARLAQQGKYLDARIHLISAQRLLQRAMTSSTDQENYLSFIVQAEKLDQFMREAQQQETILGTAKGKSRGRDDEASKAMYQMKSVSARSFAMRV
jgi:hypothetical protein